VSLHSLLVVAGEASGDQAAARVLSRLPGVAAFGMGGASMAAAGAELVRDLRGTTGMGTTELGTKVPRVLGAMGSIVAEAKRRQPNAALLVGYSDFNLSLAGKLMGRGIPLVFYGAPQIWAWRAGRAKKLAHPLASVAVTLPFEEAIWRSHGAEAHYVGHPALEARRLPGTMVRDSLGLTQRAKALALLPGSRPHEVRALLPAMLTAFERLRKDRASIDARVLLAQSLDEGTLAWARQQARAARTPAVISTTDAGAAEFLPAFDAALCASGTVCLEAALAGAVPIMAYRVGMVSELLVRALVHVDCFSLPNVVLGRKAFPELLQREANSRNMAAAAMSVLGQREDYTQACIDVERAFRGANRASFMVADMLDRASDAARLRASA
jgi:lipid-A-disaccharide synthase